MTADPIDFFVMAQQRCPDCGGSGKASQAEWPGTNCRRCNGHGYLPVTISLQELARQLGRLVEVTVKDIKVQL